MSKGNSRFKPFPTTKWSLLARVTSGEQADRERALSEICTLYRPPIYAYIRNLGHQSHDAEDLTQEFFTRFLSHDNFKRPDPKLGKLRTYLLTSVTYFLRGEYRRGIRKKRGGGAAVVSMDTRDDEGHRPLDAVSDERSPDLLFDRQWAETLLENVIRKLESHCHEAGEGTLFEQLLPFLRTGDGAPSQSEVAGALGISQGALRVRLHRFRARYRRLLQAEVAATLDPDDDVDAEIAYLRSLFV